jgi:hypothetical protein
MYFLLQGTHLPCLDSIIKFREFEVHRWYYNTEVEGTALSDVLASSIL